MNTFLHFIEETTHNELLRDEFFNTLQNSKSSEELNQWFKSKEIHVALDECRKIIENDQLFKENKIKYFMGGY